MIEKLNDSNRKSVYDFVQYLIDRQIKEFWDQVDSSDPDKEPLTRDELEQLREGDEFISWEEAKSELGL